MMQQVSNFGPNSSDVDTRDKGRHRTGEHTFNWEVSEIMIPSQMHVKEITSGTGLQWSAFSVLSVTEFQTFTLNSDCFPYLRMHKGFLGKCQNVMSVLGRYFTRIWRNAAGRPGGWGQRTVRCNSEALKQVQYTSRWTRVQNLQFYRTSG